MAGARHRVCGPCEELAQWVVRPGVLDDPPRLNKSGPPGWFSGRSVVIGGGLDGGARGRTGDQEDWAVRVLAVPRRHRSGRVHQFDALTAVTPGPCETRVWFHTYEYLGAPACDSSGPGTCLNDRFGTGAGATPVTLD